MLSVCVLGGITSFIYLFVDFFCLLACVKLPMSLGAKVEGGRCPCHRRSSPHCSKEGSKVPSVGLSVSVIGHTAMVTCRERGEVHCVCPISYRCVTPRLSQTLSLRQRASTASLGPWETPPMRKSMLGVWREAQEQRGLGRGATYSHLLFTWL